MYLISNYWCALQGPGILVPSVLLVQCYYPLVGARTTAARVHCQ